MKKIIIFVVLALLLLACNKKKNEEVDSPRSEVYKKEYRTVETIREDEQLGTLRKYSKYSFDVPYNGQDGYVDYLLLERNCKDSIIQEIKYIHPFQYRQIDQLIIVNYDDPKLRNDTILYFGDSIIDKYNMTYYYYGPVSVE